MAGGEVRANAGLVVQPLTRQQRFTFFFWACKNMCSEEWGFLCEGAHPNAHSIDWVGMPHSPNRCTRAVHHWGAVVRKNTKTHRHAFSGGAIFYAGVPVRAVETCLWGQGALSWGWERAAPMIRLSFLFPLFLFFFLLGKLTWTYINLFLPLSSQGKKERKGLEIPGWNGTHINVPSFPVLCTILTKNKLLWSTP